MTEEQISVMTMDAVHEYSEAKIAMARIEKRISLVASAFTGWGSALEHPSARSFYVTEGKLKAPFVNQPLSLLLNGDELTALIVGWNEARTNLKSKRDQMDALGLGNIQ